VPYEEIKEAFRPESLLPMKLSENQVRDSIRTWYGSRWFAPNKLKRAALTDTVKGLYIPYWTFDAQVHADWTAESGYYYYETETYTDANGRTQTRQVQKIRWEFSSGSLDHFFDDELVPASRGVQEAMLRKIEPFPTTTELVPYNAGYLSGWVVERYQIDLVAAAQEAREEMDEEMERLCAAQVPGDTHRNLQVQSDYSGQTFKHILTPIWLLTYNYGAQHFQVVINGYTGVIAGKYPKSWVKITLAVLAALAAAALAGVRDAHPQRIMEQEMMKRRLTRPLRRMSSPSPGSSSTPMTGATAGRGLGRRHAGGRSEWSFIACSRRPASRSGPA
jgi:hypothetical protein